jgi:hypothetical protein
LRLVTRFEPVAPVADTCGAHDWSVLHQRMHYILHLFRSWHEHPELASQPYTASQLASINAGVIPEGDQETSDPAARCHRPTGGRPSPVDAQSNTALPLTNGDGHS